MKTPGRRIFLSVEAARNLVMGLNARDRELKEAAKRDGWRPSELAMALADVAELREMLLNEVIVQPAPAPARRARKESDDA